MLFTTSPNKTADAKRLGAHEVVVSKNEAEMQKHVNSFDFILDTVPAHHGLDAYLNLLKRDGTLSLVGAPDSSSVVRRDGFAICAVGKLRARSSEAFARRRRCWISAPSTESLRTSNMIGIQQINEAFERLIKGDVKYRFVIDMASLK